MFGNPQNFGVMVERGYPMVWSNRDLTFLDQQTFDAFTIQTLRLRDINGGIHVLEYRMIETPNGWRIAGVQVLPQPDVGA